MVAGIIVIYDVFTQIVNSDIPCRTFNNSRYLCWCNGRYTPVYAINTLGILYIDSITDTDVVSGYNNFPVWMIHGLPIMNVKRVLCCQVYPVRMINIL